MALTSTGSRHIGWIDYAKAFAIFSVVFLHTHCDAALTTAMKGYTMPLFFFLSGFLFSRERNPDFKPFLKKRCRQLLIPYLWINAVAYIAWITVLRNYGTDHADALQWHEPLWGILLGIPPYLAHDIPMWSIICFFMVEMAFYLLPSEGKRNSLIIACCAFIPAAAISLLAGSEGVAWPLAIGPTFAGLAFYALGHYVRAIQDKLKFIFILSPALLILGVAMLICAVSFNSPSAFFIGVMGNPFIYLFGAIGGIVMAIQVSIFLDRIFHDGKLVRLISKGTLLICGFHLLAFALIKGVMLFGFGIGPESLTDGFLPGLAFSLAAMALCIPLILLVEKYLKFLVGK